MRRGNWEIAQERYQTTGNKTHNAGFLGRTLPQHAAVHEQTAIELRIKSSILFGHMHLFPFTVMRRSCWPRCSAAAPCCGEYRAVGASQRNTFNAKYARKHYRTGLPWRTKFRWVSRPTGRSDEQQGVQVPTLEPRQERSILLLEHCFAKDTFGLTSAPPPSGREKIPQATVRSVLHDAAEARRITSCGRYT